MAPFLILIRRLFPPLLIRRRLLIFVLLLACYGLAVYALVEFEDFPHIDWGAESTVMNGVVLGFLIAFRNNHAYDRWWEGRKLWGQLVNDSRNLCLKVRSLTGIDPAQRHAVAKLVTDFATALEQHLRRKQPPAYPAAKPGTAAPTVHEPRGSPARSMKSFRAGGGPDWSTAGRCSGSTRTSRA